MRFWVSRYGPERAMSDVSAPLQLYKEEYMIKRLFTIVATFALLLGMASAQTTLVFGQSGLPVTLDTGQDGNSLTPSYQILENLVFFEPGTGIVTEGLATDWSANDDATAWTFTLREGVTFQDGTPFNAEAVKFNFDRWNDPANEYRFDKTFVPWTWIFGGFLGEGSVLDSVDVNGEYELTLNLNEPVSFIPAMVASSYFGLHSPAAIEEAGAAYGTPNFGSVGTGPFSFVEWQDGSQVVLERNDNYWDELAGVERLVFLGIEDPTARLAQLKSGAIDIAVNLSSDDYQSVLDDENLDTAMVEANLNVGYLAFHQDNEPFGDVRIRQAVAHAIDQEAIVEAFYAGLGQVASQHVPPALWGRAELEPTAYDPERAMELLAEAGFEDGFSTELWYMPVSRPYYPAPEDIATVMATYLADVGIDVELRTQDWGTYLENYDQGEFPMYMLGWSADFADPDNFLYTFFGPSVVGANGWTGERQEEVLDLLNAARRASTQAERQELYEQVNTIISEEMIQLPVAHNRVLNAVQTNVSGFVPSPLGSTIPLKTVTVGE